MNPRKEKLNAFLERINELVRDAFVTFGTTANFPNTISPNRQIGMNLQRAAIDFARGYVSPRATGESVQGLADKVEGHILAGNTLGALSDKEMNQLSQELRDLVEER